MLMEIEEALVTMKSKACHFLAGLFSLERNRVQASGPLVVTTCETPLQWPAGCAWATGIGGAVHEPRSLTSFLASKLCAPPSLLDF